MRREFQVRFCEGPGVQFPRATRLVVGFQKQSDAERFLNDLRERFRGFALELHPDKTRLLELGRFAAERRAKRGLGAPETFDFLGFTHVFGKARSGNYLLVRRTMPARMRARLPRCESRSGGADICPSRCRARGCGPWCADTSRTTPCPRTSLRCSRFDVRSFGTGTRRFGAEVSETG